jgi:hypothetical protein
VLARSSEVPEQNQAALSVIEILEDFGGVRVRCVARGWTPSEGS